MKEINSRGFRPESVTKQRVRVIKHPTREEWAACIPDDLDIAMYRHINEEERELISSRLSTEADLRAAGWFPDRSTGNQTIP